MRAGFEALQTKIRSLEIQCAGAPWGTVFECESVLWVILKRGPAWV